MLEQSYLGPKDTYLVSMFIIQKVIPDYAVLVVRIVEMYLAKVVQH
jgi:hypothetical protein